MGFSETIRPQAACELPEIMAMRCYAAALDYAEPVLPSMVEMGRRRGINPPAAIALASVFQITEACLGRRLIAGPGRGASLSDDENAVLLMLRVGANLGSHVGSETVPHGLPGVLVWAIRSARRLCRIADGPTSLAHDTACPFHQ